MKQCHTVTVGQYEVTGEVYYEWIDDSFDHAFGTEHCGHEEAVDVDILEAYKLVEGDSIEIHVSEIPSKILVEAIERLKQEKI